MRLVCLLHNLSTHWLWKNNLTGFNLLLPPSPPLPLPSFPLPLCVCVCKRVCVCVRTSESFWNSSCLVTPGLCKWDRSSPMAALSSPVVCGLSLVFLAICDAKKTMCLCYSGGKNRIWFIWIKLGLLFFVLNLGVSRSHLTFFPSLPCVSCVSLSSVLQRVKKHNETSCLEPWPLFPFLLESFQCYLYETSGPTIKKPSRPG